jgi:hypothetical protein
VRLLAIQFDCSITPALHHRSNNPHIFTAGKRRNIYSQRFSYSERICSPIVLPIWNRLPGIRRQSSLSLTMTRHSAVKCMYVCMCLLSFGPRSLSVLIFGLCMYVHAYKSLYITTKRNINILQVSAVPSKYWREPNTYILTAQQATGASPMYVRTYIHTYGGGMIMGKVLRSFLSFDYS